MTSPLTNDTVTEVGSDKIIVMFGTIPVLVDLNELNWTCQNPFTGGPSSWSSMGPFTGTVGHMISGGGVHPTIVPVGEAIPSIGGGVRNNSGGGGFGSGGGGNVFVGLTFSGNIGSYFGTLGPSFGTVWFHT